MDREILARTMSQENVETVRRVYEGVNARLEAPRELFDSDYEFDNTELWPDIVGVLGFEAAQEAMREYWETFEAYHVEIEEVMYADEGRVVDVVRDGGRMRGTDAEAWNRFFHVWTFRDGRVVRLSIHTTGTEPSKPLGCRSSAEVLLGRKAACSATRTKSGASRRMARSIWPVRKPAA
jgi:ketosteroid isomerase-like protein